MVRPSNPQNTYTSFKYSDHPVIRKGFRKPNRRMAKRSLLTRYQEIRELPWFQDATCQFVKLGGYLALFAKRLSEFKPPFFKEGYRTNLRQREEMMYASSFSLRQVASALSNLGLRALKNYHPRIMKNPTLISLQEMVKIAESNPHSNQSLLKHVLKWVELYHKAEREFSEDLGQFILNQPIDLEKYKRRLAKISDEIKKALQYGLIPLLGEEFFRNSNFSHFEIEDSEFRKLIVLTPLAIAIIRVKGEKIEQENILSLLNTARFWESDTHVETTRQFKSGVDLYSTIQVVVIETLLGPGEGRPEINPIGQIRKDIEKYIFDQFLE